MIVHPLPTGWQIIYHRAHALQAAQIAALWRPNLQPPFMAEISAAIAQHDDMEREWDGRHLTPAGTPLDFTENTEIAVAPLRREIEGARYRGRLVALLTSLHLSYLNEPRRGQDAALDAFLDEQRQQQHAWRTALHLTQKETESAYAFLLWCDRLSLILCMNQIPDAGRMLEIERGPDGQRYELYGRTDGSLAIHPWPFAAKAADVSVEAVEVGQVTFRDDAEFSQALQTSPIVTRTWQFRHSDS